MQMRSKIRTVLLPDAGGFKLGKSTFTASGFGVKLVSISAVSLTYIHTNNEVVKSNKFKHA